MAIVVTKKRNCLFPNNKKGRRRGGGGVSFGYILFVSFLLLSSSLLWHHQQQQQHDGRRRGMMMMMAVDAFSIIRTPSSSSSIGLLLDPNNQQHQLQQQQRFFQQQQRSRNKKQQRQLQILFSQTKKKDEPTLLTDQEEAVLFGDEKNEIHPDYRSEKRVKDIYGNILSDKTILPTTTTTGDNKNNNNSMDGNYGKVTIELDHAPNYPIVNKLRTMRDVITNCPELWIELSQIIPNERALYDNHMCDAKIDYTFADAAGAVQTSAAIFQHYMNQVSSSTKTKTKTKQKHVAIFAENSAYWLFIDHGIQMAGGVSAVRGADAPVNEIRYIYEHSDSCGIVVLQDVQLLQKLYNDAKTDPAIQAPLGFYNELYGNVQTIILMHRGRSNKNTKAVDEIVQQIAAELNIQIFFFSDLLEEYKMDKNKNKKNNKNNQLLVSSFPEITKNDLATIVYTSGTTGYPKGVMLTHGNLLHQLTHRLAPSKPYIESEPMPGDTMVSLLPVWHITERTFELWMLSRGCNVVYSSIRTFKKDLALHKPHWMVLVPRVLEKVATGVQEKFSTSGTAVKTLAKFFTSIGKQYTMHTKIINGLVVDDIAPGPLEKAASKIALSYIKPLHVIGQKLVWSKVQDGFGGRLRLIISGGSALAGGLESFYETAGLTICVGYGLTECSPLLAYRRSDANLVAGGCTGKACIDTEIRIVDTEAKVNGEHPRPSVPTGQAGLVIAKGPQVMKGYYKNPEATAKAIDKFGWFDTGDLGRINPATGDLILTGRAKDTIVLSNGENVEPVPIEDAILGDIPMVEQVMITTAASSSEGDGRGLIGITVLNPQELYDEGFLQDKDLVAKLTEAMEIVNSPQCTVEDCTKYCSELLNPISEQIRSNPKLYDFLVTNVRDVIKAKKTFRKWEMVQDFYVTLEPFAMVNGQLTQSYKVKRAAVMERYQKQICEWDNKQHHNQHFHSTE